MIEKFMSYKDQMAILGKHAWSVPRLITLSKDLEVMEIPLKHLNISDTYSKLTIRQFVGHVQAVLDADLRYPIILDEDGEIMDGRHRVMKAILQNKETIKAVRFEENPSPCQVRE